MLRTVETSLGRPTSLSNPARISAHCRLYANQTQLGTTTASTGSHRKRVTAFNDDGRVPWGQLSAMEKAGRTTQQSFNFGLIAVGGAATVGVILLLYTDVFSADSGVTHYNKAVNRITSDPQCIELLGKNINALGAATGTAWIRRRPKANTQTDKLGTERLNMSFHVSGDRNQGVAHLYMIRRQDESHYSYGHLAIDVPGQPRLYVENGQGVKQKSEPGKFFGVRWS